MKWLSILKDKTGKFVMNAQNALITSVAASAMITTVAYNAGTTQGEEELQVRQLSSISDTHNYGGMVRTADGQLTSMQFKDGLNQIATREERERLQGNSANNDFGLNAVAGIERNVAGAGYGPQAQTSATEGLGMGANSAVEIGSATAGGGAGVGQGGNGSSRASVQAPGQGDGGGEGGAGGGQGAAGGAQLSSASMATASGSAFNAAAGAINGGNAGGAGSTRAGGAGGSEGMRFSGAMPNSTGAAPELSRSGGLGNSHNSTNFMAGSRHGNINKNSGSRSGAGDLKDISKRSADAAKNRNRSNTEGAKAFMANNTDSAGMTFENGETNEQTGSSDFDTNDAALNNLKSWGQQTEDTENEQSKDRKSLLIFLLSTIAAAAVIIPLASWIMTLSESPFAGFLKVLGYALLGALAGLAGYLIYKAGAYSAKYHATWFPLISMIAGAGVAGLAVYTMVNYKTVHAKLIQWKASIMKSIWSNLGVPAATTVVQSGINSDK